MSEIIRADNVGIRFRVKTSVKRVLRDLALPGAGDNRKEDGGFWALRGISFSIDKGDILGVIGSNGAGKSTLLRTIGGVYHPDEGTMKVSGSVSALLSLGTGFKQDLSGYDNIFLNGVILGFTPAEIKAQLDNIIAFSELNDFILEPVKNYSSGMRARLGFSIAAYLARDIMLIDEILGVGDFRFKKKSQDKMVEMIQDGRTVVIVSHNLDSIRRYATKAIWIDKGQLIEAGPAEEVIAKYEAS